MKTLYGFIEYSVYFSAFTGNNPNIGLRTWLISTREKHCEIFDWMWLISFMFIRLHSAARSLWGRVFWRFLQSQVYSPRLCYLKCLPQDNYTLFNPLQPHCFLSLFLPLGFSLFTSLHFISHFFNPFSVNSSIPLFTSPLLPLSFLWPFFVWLYPTPTIRPPSSPRLSRHCALFNLDQHLSGAWPDMIKRRGPAFRDGAPWLTGSANNPKWLMSKGLSW